MNKGIWFVGLLVFMAGCATGFRLVPSGEDVVVGPFTASPQIEWSSIRGAKGVFWTVDGLVLETLYFSDPVHDGQALFVKDAKAKVPRFRTGMTANEVAEFVADSLAAGGAKQVTSKGLGPRTFAGLNGFELELELLSDNGLEKRVLVAGGERDGALYVAIYNAARQYYYDKYLDAVQRIFASLRIAKRPAA